MAEQPAPDTVVHDPAVVLVAAAAAGDHARYEVTLADLQTTGGQEAVYGSLHALTIAVLERARAAHPRRAEAGRWATTGQLPGDEQLADRIATVGGLVRAGVPLDQWHQDGEPVNVNADALALCALVVALAKVAAGPDVPIDEPHLAELSRPPQG